MLISLAVRLIIPDTTAVSAARALRQAGLTELAALRREGCWEFETDGNAAANDMAARLLRADVLVNYNKHRGRWWPGPLDACPDGAPDDDLGLHWAALLVEDRDDGEPARMERILTTRLGFAALRVARRAALWWVGVASADAASLAEQAASTLLVNRHGQRSRVLALAPAPSPLGGVPRRQDPV